MLGKVGRRGFQAGSHHPGPKRRRLAQRYAAVREAVKPLGYAGLPSIARWPVRKVASNEHRVLGSRLICQRVRRGGQGRT